MSLQAKEQQRLPANHQKREERHGMDFPHSCQKNTGKPASTLILDVQLSELRDNKLLLSNTRSCWYFVMTALAK